MLIDSQNPEELAALLQRGYFINGRQRIIREEREGAPFTKIRLWDDWEARESHLYASSLAFVLEIARINLRGWQWYPDGVEPAQAD